MFSSLRLSRSRSQGSQGPTSCASGDKGSSQGLNGDVERHVYQVTPQSPQGGPQGSSCPSSPLLSGKPPKTPRSTARRASKWGLDKALCPSIGSLRDRPGPGDEDALQGADEVCACSKVTRVAVPREDGCLGITLRGGSPRALVITSVKPGGPADREGSIRPGDRLLAVDGTNLQLADLTAAQAALQGQAPGQGQGGGVAVLTIEYSVCVVGAVVGAAGPLLVELARPPAHQLGLTLATVQTACSGSAVLVDAIKPASVADRSGALHRGDQILAVDDVHVDGTDLTAADVAVLLTGSGAGSGSRVLRLEVLPAHCLQAWPDSTRSQPGVRGGMSTPQKGPSQQEAQLSSHLCPSMGAMATGSSPGASESGLSVFNSIASRRRRIGRAFDAGSVASSSGSLAPSARGGSGSRCGSRGPSAGLVTHVETLTVTLRPELAGGCGPTYGLAVRASGPARTPVISALHPGGPAERSGCLQVGDCVLALGDREVDAERLAQVLDSPGPPLTLQVSFAVAESVVPSSGVFAVKLAKSSQWSGLGITIQGSKSAPGDCLLISDIKRGSVAHRSGTLSPGDRLLAIDGLPLAGRTLDDAARILHASGGLVTLKVLKEDVPSDTGSSWSGWGNGWVGGWGSGWNRCVEYTVELVRHGGPLGLTIAGSEDPMDSVTISGLTPGGLAEQTGALHIGDRLLAINGESLCGRRLSEAISLFQNSPDTVTLKVARSSTTAGKMERDAGVAPCASRLPSAAIPSVDSAVESWDSSLSQHNASPAGTPHVLPMTLDGRVENRPPNNGESTAQVPAPGRPRLTPMSPPLSRRAGSCPSLDCHLQSEGVSETGDGAEWDGSLEDLESAATTAANLSLRAPNNSLNYSDESTSVAPSSPILPPVNFRQQDSPVTSRAPVWPRPPPSPSGRMTAARALNLDWQRQKQQQQKQQQLQQQQHQQHHQQQHQQQHEQTQEQRSDVDNFSTSPKLSSFQWTNNINNNINNNSNCSNNNNNTLPRNRRANDVNPSQSTVRHYDDFAELNNNLTRGRGLHHFIFEEQRASSLLSEEVAEDVIHNLGLQAPMQLFQVTIYKDSVYEDFGFSVSDGLYERGVFINRIRKGGPADATGVLRPYDRILQVNETRTHDFDCCLTVPLIAAAGDRIHLIVARHPNAVQANTDTLPWLEEEQLHDSYRSAAEMHHSLTTVTQTI